MGKITDLNVTGLETFKHAALLGDAHEMLVAGILSRLGFEVGLIAAKGGAYDLWVIAYKEKGNLESIRPIRVQVKTVSSKGSVKFIGGVRSGSDRRFTGDGLVSKKYKYTEKHNDLIIGVTDDELALYLIPTKFIAKWGDSKSTGTLQLLKNNWNILLNWNSKYLTALENKLP